MSENDAPLSPDAAAEAWFARLSQKRVAVETLREFRAWRLDPANATAYRKLERLWRLAGELARDPEMAIAAREARDKGGT